MATYIVFGKYTLEGMKEMSAKRTEKAEAVIKKFGGKTKAAYALLGEVDLVFVIEFPGMEKAMQASAALSRLLNIAFTTSPAVTVEEFDKLLKEI
jgi:uncharacterized protein with GYD domain